MYIRIKKLESRDVEKIKDLDVKVFVEIPYIELAKEFNDKRIFKNQEYRKYFLKDKEMGGSDKDKMYHMTSKGVVERYSNEFLDKFLKMKCNLVIYLESRHLLSKICSIFDIINCEKNISKIYDNLNHFENFFNLQEGNKELNIFANWETWTHKQLEYIYADPDVKYDNLYGVLVYLIGRSNYRFDLNNYFIFKKDRHYPIGSENTIIQVNTGDKINYNKLSYLDFYLRRKRDNYIKYNKNEEEVKMETGNYEDLLKSYNL